MLRRQECGGIGKDRSQEVGERTDLGQGGSPAPGHGLQIPGCSARGRGVPCPAPPRPSGTRAQPTARSSAASGGYKCQGGDRGLSRGAAGTSAVLQPHWVAQAGEWRRAEERRHWSEGGIPGAWQSRGARPHFLPKVPAQPQGTRQRMQPEPEPGCFPRVRSSPGMN